MKRDSGNAKSVWNCAIGAFAVLAAFCLSQNVQAADDAPFGFTWSQSKESLPDPSFVIVDAIRRLTYRNSKLPR